MWDLLGLLGLLVLVLAFGAWVAFRLMDENERINGVIASFDDDDCDTEENDFDWDWDDRRWFLVDDGDEPKWSGQ